MVLDEGDPYSLLLLNKSINNLKARNIFKTVGSKVIEGSKPGLKVVKIDVEEKPTGEITLGAGFGSEGGSIGFAVSENNYLGKGIKLDTSLNITEERITAMLAVTNPNYNYTDNSLSDREFYWIVDRNNYKSPDANANMNCLDFLIKSRISFPDKSRMFGKKQLYYS